jgi:hypothetical protein
LKSSAVLRIEIVLLASYKILLDFARVHATTLLQLVGDLQLYLNLQCVEKSGGKYILKDFFLNLTLRFQ